MPLGFDRDVRLIHPPRSADRFREPIPPLLELRDVAGYPAKESGPIRVLRSQAIRIGSGS
jgi:hypothetical protein